MCNQQTILIHNNFARIAGYKCSVLRPCKYMSTSLSMGSTVLCCILDPCIPSTTHKGNNYTKCIGRRDRQVKNTYCAEDCQRLLDVR